MLLLTVSFLFPTVIVITAAVQLRCYVLAAGGRFLLLSEVIDQVRFNFHKNRKMFLSNILSESKIIFVPRS